MISSPSLQNLKPVGILGDGQLALMLGEAAQAQGIDFLAFGDDSNSSFANRFPENFILSTAHPLAKNKDHLRSLIRQASLNEFAGMCSALTLENEFYSADQLQKLSSASGTPVVPDPQSYLHFQNKISQREFYQSLEIPGPRWTKLVQPNAPFAFPLVVKASQGGYDGYGVRIVKTELEFQQAITQFGFHQGKEILIEEKVEMVSEFAQGILLDGKGKVVFLPLVETVQENGTCVLTLSRLTLSQDEREAVSSKIKESLTKIARSTLQGLFNFEFFYTRDGNVLINEGAPRPHNSQHLTIDASPVSQFALLMKYLAGDSTVFSLGEIPTRPAAMINLLGKSLGTEYALTLPPLPAELEVYPKLYLKKECRPGRKMGHLNLVDPSGKLDLISLGEKILKEYQL